MIQGGGVQNDIGHYRSYVERPLRNPTRGSCILMCTDTSLSARVWAHAGSRQDPLHCRTHLKGPKVPTRESADEVPRSLHQSIGARPLIGLHQNTKGPSSRSFVS